MVVNGKNAFLKKLYVFELLVEYEADGSRTRSQRSDGYPFIIL